MAFEVYYSFLHRNEDPFKADHYKIYRQSATGSNTGAYSQVETLYPTGAGNPITITGMDIVPSCSVSYNYKVSAYNTQGEIFCINPVLSGINFPCPTPSPSVTTSPSKTPSPSISVSVTPSLTVTPTLTPSVQTSPTPTPTISSSVTATPTSSPPAGSPSPTPTISATNTPTPSVSVSVTATPSSSAPAESPSPTPTVSPSLSVSPTVTPSLSVSPTVTPSLSVSPTVTPSLSVSPTVTPSLSVSPSPSPSTQSLVNIQYDSNTYVLCNSNNAQVTWNGTHNIQEVTAVGYNSYSSSEHIGSAIKGYENNGHVEVIAGLGATPGETRYFVCASHPSKKFKTTCAAIPSPTPTATPSSTTTPSVSPSHSVTPTATPSLSVSPTATPSVSVTNTPSPSLSVTPTATPSVSVTNTPTPSLTQTPTPTPSSSPPSAGGGDGNCWQYFDLTSNAITAGNFKVKVNSTNFNNGHADLAWPAGATGFEIRGVPKEDQLQSGQGVAYYFETYDADGPVSSLYSKIPNYVNVASVDPDNSTDYSAAPTTDGPHLIDFGLYKCLNASCASSEEASVLEKSTYNDPIVLKIKFTNEFGQSSYEEMPANTNIQFSGRFLPC